MGINTSYIYSLLQMTLQRFIDDLFESILQPDNSSVPLCIKYLFDLFDDAAKQYGISDPEVVHVWKTNR
jgi:plexin A